MTVFYASKGVREEDRKWVNDLFSSCGKCLEVDCENAVNASTAISGGGPAYLFFLAEQMIEAGKELGFDSEDSELIARQTLKGAALLLEQQVSVAELRQMVTSPGGTTEAALNCFAEGKAGEIIKSGLNAAYRRAIELSEPK